MLVCYWIVKSCLGSSGSARGIPVLSLLLLLHGTVPVLSCKQLRNCLDSTRRCTRLAE
jgi:hypothetical protein